MSFSALGYSCWKLASPCVHHENKLASDPHPFPTHCAEKKKKTKPLIPLAVILIRRLPVLPVYHPYTSKVLLPILILQKPCPCYFSTAHLNCRLLLRIVYWPFVVKPTCKNHRVPCLNFQNKRWIVYKDAVLRDKLNILKKIFCEYIQTGTISL